MDVSKRGWSEIVAKEGDQGRSARFPRSKSFADDSEGEKVCVKRSGALHEMLTIGEKAK